MMNNIQELNQIIADAPEDDEITNVGHHKSVGTIYFTDWNYMGKYYFFDEDGVLTEAEELSDLVDCSYETATNIQLLADIRTIIEQAEENKALKVKIAELEKEVADHKANIDHLMNNCHRFTDKRLQEHNLEQQAKGAVDICNKALEKIVMPEDMSSSRSECFKAGVRALAYVIEKQAKQLKAVSDETDT